MLHRHYRVLCTAALAFATMVGCGGTGPEQQAGTAKANARPTAQKLEAALLTEADVSGYHRRGATSGTLQSMGYQEVFKRLQELDADKPECLGGFLGGISGPAFQDLKQAPAAMTIFSGSSGSFGQIIVSVPSTRGLSALRQPIPSACLEITVSLPDGQMMTMSTQEIDVAPLGEQARAFRGKVVVGDKRSVILSETIRSGRFLHNIQVRGGDRKTLEKLAERAVRRAQQRLS